MDVFSGLITIFVFFCLSAFFSGSETALTSLSKFRLKKIAALEKSLKDVLSKWLVYPQQILVTILVGNTIVNMSISFFSTLLVLRFFEKSVPREVLEFATWITVTSLILMFGEILPKIYSRKNPEQVTLSIIRPLGLLSELIFPLIRPIMFLVDKLVPTMDFIPVGRITSLSIEEVRNLVLDSRNRGLLLKETGEMMEGVLKLDNMKASDIMVPANKVDAVNIEENANSVVSRFAELGRSRIPVYRGDKTKIEGVVLLKDLLSKTKPLGVNCTFDEFPSDIVRPPYIIPSNKKVSELLHEFQSGLSNCAIITDKQGKFKGFVTLEDILEEIVGEILDEYDISKKRPETEAGK